MVLKFSIRRLLRFWRLNLVVIFGLSLGSALLAGLPTFATISATTALKQSLTDEHPAARNIQIEGQNLTGALNKFVTDTLGDLIVSRMVVRNLTGSFDAREPIIPVDEDQRLDPQEINIWSFDKMMENLRLVEGQWPEYYEPHTQQEIQRLMLHNEIDAIIDWETASISGIKIGDRLKINPSTIEFLVVGISERIDPKNEIWWGDSTPFIPIFRPGINEDTIKIPIIIHPRSMSEYLPIKATTWRYLVDSEAITADNAQAIEENLIGLKAQIKSSQATMTTNLPNILLAYRENLSMTRMVLSFLAIQAFLFTLYTLTLFITILLEQSEGEIITLSGRGASEFKITRIFGTESFILASLSGLIIGPGIAYLALQTWSFSNGVEALIQFPLEAWGYAICGAGFGWLVLVFSTFQAARRNIMEWQQRRTRPMKFTGWQRKYLDIFLLLIGVVAYWQLTTSGSFILQRFGETDTADPLLLLSPTILIIALALFFLRLFPYLLQIGARIARSGRGLTWSIGFSRLARAPVQPSRVVLLISMATGLSLFAISFSRSLAQSQVEIAHYLAGADLRITPSNHPPESFQNIPGILQISPVFRSAVTNAEGKLTTILVVDSETFSQVAASYPQGMTNLTIDTVVSGLRTNQNNPPDSDQANVSIPGIFSKSALSPGTEFGSEQDIKFNIHTIPVSLRGLIRNFPTLSGAFVLVDKNALENATHLKIEQIYRSEEVWVSIDPEQYTAIIDHPIFLNSIIADAQKTLRGMQNNAFMQGSLKAFSMNALILTILSITSFFFVSYFAARNRSYEFGILQALGLSSKSVAGIWLGEGILILFFGLLGGAGIGLSMTRMMRPYLNHILTKVIANTVVYQIRIDWKITLALMGVLALFYLTSMLITLAGISKAELNRVIRIGDE